MESNKLRTSFSSMSKFTQCPRQWWLSDVRSLAPVDAPLTGALPFGGRMHTALEWWSKGEVESPLEGWEIVSREAEAVEAGRGGLGMADLDKETVLGSIMLEGFANWWEEEGEDQEFEIISVEKELRNELEVVTPSGDLVSVWLYGKLDRVLKHRDNGQIWVADWKSTRLLQLAAMESLEMSPQPRIYAELLAQSLGFPISGIRFTFLRKVKRSGSAKPPFWFNYDLALSQYNIKQHMDRVSAWAGKMVSTVESLEAGVSHETAAPFNPGWWCKTCPFRNVCMIYQTAGEQAAEDMLEDHFAPRDPLERYTSEALAEGEDA